MSPDRALVLADGDPRVVMASSEVRTVYLGQELPV